MPALASTVVFRSGTVISPKAVRTTEVGTRYMFCRCVTARKVLRGVQVSRQVGGLAAEQKAHGDLRLVIFPVSLRYDIIFLKLTE